MAETPSTELPPAPARQPGGKRRSRGRRALKWLLLLLLLPVALLLSLLLVVIVGLQTGPGRRLAARTAAERVTELLQGRLSVGSVELKGALRICLRQVSLDDPETGPVISADSVCVEASALALAKQHGVLNGATIVHPVVDIADIVGADGVKTTTLSRALSARNPEPKTAAPGKPLAWIIELHDLQLERGEVRLRPAPKAAPSLDLESIAIHGAKARYAQDGAMARLGLTGELKAPGDLPVAIDLDATLDGAADAGKLRLHKLHAAAGDSNITAWGELDLATRAGKLEISEIKVAPADVDKLLHKKNLLLREVTGKGQLSSDGHTATARLSLGAGHGQIELQAKSTLAAAPEWSVKLQAKRIDPSLLAAAAPKGEVTVLLDARGKGIPSYDERGPLGDFEGKLQVGPAQLVGMGELKLDLDAVLAGRRGLVRAFTAAGLGLRLAANGKAERDAVDLAVELDAPDLRAVAHAIGALAKKPPPDLGGSVHLSARVHGKPLHPDAEVHLRAPSFLSGGQLLDVAALAIDGQVHGDLRNPKEVRPEGTLQVSALNARIGEIELGHPDMRTDLRWPGAFVHLVAEVLGGKLEFRGQARIDDDGDGLHIPELTVSYPGNELKLRSAANIHFRQRSTEVEPLWLEGAHGSLGLSGSFYKPAQKGGNGSVDAALALTKFDLSKLPEFALPKDLNLRGLVSGRIVVDGKMPRPAVDAHLELQGGGARRVQGFDAKIYAHAFKDRVRAEGDGSGPAGVRLAFKADAPLGSPAKLPLSAPLHGELVVRELDLAKAAEIAGNDRISKTGVKGLLNLKVAFEGTLQQPKATVSVDLRHFNIAIPKKAVEMAADTAVQAQKGAVGSAGKSLDAATAALKQTPPPGETIRVDEGELHLGLLLERGLLSFDGSAAFAGSRPVTLWVLAPFDSAKALREPGYLVGALQRKVRATLAAPEIDLAQLASIGLLPAGSTGQVGAEARVEGTPLAPQLSVTATAQGIEMPQVHGIGGRLEITLDKELRVNLRASAGEDTLGTLDLSLGVTAAEVAELRRLKDPREMAQKIAGRALKGSLEVPGLYVGRAAALAGKQHVLFNGRLTGRVKLEGTPGEPSIVGKMALQEVVTRTQRLGHAELYLEGGPAGATAHLGISPPGGGTFLAHATLKADLTARALLAHGSQSVMEGEMDGRLTAKNLDLSVFSGITPIVRRIAGTADGDVVINGLLGKLHTTGKASLRKGLFDVVGQGIFHHVEFDATFSPKEIVLDRLVGQLGPGTFAAILVANRRPAPDTDGGSERLEFTGEIHLGDDESVRDLKEDGGKPRPKRSIPIRQAGADRVEINGEVDLFGSYDHGLLIANAKIPDATIHVLSLPSKKLPSLAPDPDILLVHPGEEPHPPGIEPEEARAEAKARRTANLRVQASLDITRLYVRADDFEFPVKSNLNFEYDARRPDKPTADGTILVPNGSFTALGRRFQIENALITETGGNIADPELEVKARYEKGSTVVFINVSGTAGDPVIDLQSNPPMDQDAIAFFLATGRVQGRATQNGGGVDLSGAATSIAGSLLFGQVRKELADVLPVDVLTIEASGSTIAQASVGKYIGDQFFIGYRQRLTPAPNENTSEGRIEYEVSRSVTAEATLGDHNSDVSILWSHDF